MILVGFHPIGISATGVCDRCVANGESMEGRTLIRKVCRIFNFKSHESDNKPGSFGKLAAGMLFCCISFSFAGCASDVYRYGFEKTKLANQPISEESSATILVGGEKPKVDQIERFVQTPRRMVRKLFRLPVPDPSEAELQREEAVYLADAYLASNGISDLNIDVRVYDPKLQWRRLKENRQISPLWKFTGGTIGWLRYTILPMRAFHTDHYDPFTNTLHLNSARPLQALYESGLAKEYRQGRRLGPVDIGTGAYAMMQYVPFVPLLHNARASSDVVTFAHVHLNEDLESELYPMVYGRLGSTAVSETLSVVTLSPSAPFYTTPLLRVTGGIAGRLTGKAVLLERNRKKSEIAGVAGMVLPKFGAQEKKSAPAVRQASFFQPVAKSRGIQLENLPDSTLGR